MAVATASAERPAVLRVRDDARVVVGIGEMALARAGGGVIVTHALGSCVAVCVWDPASRTGGLVHVLLPESRINPTRAATQPGTFADTGLPIFFRGFTEAGVDVRRCQIRLAGGAEVTGLAGSGSLNVGKRNLLAVRQWLWKAGLLVKAEATGGTAARTATLLLDSGTVQIRSGQTSTEI